MPIIFSREPVLLYGKNIDYITNLRKYYFLSRIFKPSGNLSWEGVEVTKYWKKMKELQSEAAPV